MIRMPIILMLVALFTISAQGEPNQSIPELAPDIAIGRENPFGLVTAKPKFDDIEEELAAMVIPQQRMPSQPDLFIETISIKFLEAANIKTVLEKMSSPFGTVTIDSLSNSILICDTRESLDKMVAQVRKIDKTPQLVEIEVAIVDVQLNSDTEIGFNWDMLSLDKDNFALRQSLTSRISAINPDETAIGTATAYNSTGLGTDISVVAGTVRGVLHLLQAKRKVEILATPRVLVASGKSASVETVEEIPYQERIDSTEGGGFAATKFKQVGVKLDVTAMITDDNSIMLTITPEQNINTGVFGINNVPIIDTRRAKSNLLLRDGEVVIMGGLRRKEKSALREQVPILGELPIIGLLFGRDKEVIINSELVVFISPHIY